MAFAVELMNQAMFNQSAVVTMTFEYIPGLPSSFHKATPIWLDITGCGNSEMPAKTNGAFQYTSPIWTANATGRITASTGHLHDGGVHLILNKSSTTVCDFSATYGQHPGFIDPGGMDMNMPGMNMGIHISSFSQCLSGRIEIGDKLSIIAFYNTSEYAPMMNMDGSLEPVMGIALLYLAQNETSGNGASS